MGVNIFGLWPAAAASVGDSLFLATWPQIYHEAEHELEPTELQQSARKAVKQQNKPEACSPVTHRVNFYTYSLCCLYDVVLGLPRKEKKIMNTQEQVVKVCGK